MPWTVQYGEKRLGDAAGYAVVSPDGATRLPYDNKSEALAERDKRNERDSQLWYQDSKP